MLFFEDWDATVAPSLEEQFEEALAREDARDHRGDGWVPEKRARIHLVVDNDGR